MNQEMGSKQLSAPRHSYRRSPARLLLVSVVWWKTHDLQPSTVTWTGLSDQTQAEGRKLRAASVTQTPLFPERCHLPLNSKDCKTAEPCQATWAAISSVQATAALTLSPCRLAAVPQSLFPCSVSVHTQLKPATLLDAPC